MHSVYRSSYIIPFSSYIISALLTFRPDSSCIHIFRERERANRHDETERIEWMREKTSTKLTDNKEEGKKAKKLTKKSRITRVQRTIVRIICITCICLVFSPLFFHFLLSLFYMLQVLCASLVFVGVCFSFTLIASKHKKYYCLGPTQYYLVFLCIVAHSFRIHLTIGWINAQVFVWCRDNQMQTDIFKVGKREPLPYSGLQKCSTNLHKALRKRQRPAIGSKRYNIVKWNIP